MTAKRKITAKKVAAGKKPSGSTATLRDSAHHSGGFPIVAIGASAGGLEAIEQFLKKVPSDTGMAFILIQHLDPTHKSILSDLIKRVTTMQVQEVSDGMKVAPNCIYVIPPNRDMGILHGRLQLIEPQAKRGMRLPIDYLLRSFAQDQEDKAICIILSGTGSDGTLGLKAVKEKGGMVMVQDPKTAKYDGMPRSAISTELADFVLAPEQMAEQLIKYVKHVYVQGIKMLPRSIAKRSEDLNKIYLLLRNQTGHDFTYYKPNTILRRIERRMTVNQFERLHDYLRYMQQSPLEVESLFKELLIGVSNFFRDPAAFESLQEKVIPALFDHRPVDEPVRIWVPGCSTGEEAYSIAMLLREAMDQLKREYKLQIFATDIDNNAIETARIGIYPESIAADISAERLRRFFTKQGNSYQVTKAIRDTLIFAEQNVIKDPPFSRLDLISCRNLMIYLEPQLQKRLLPLFHYSLRNDGYLFLGSSESISEAIELFSVIDRKWKIFQSKGAALFQPGGMELARSPFPLDIGSSRQTPDVIPARSPSPRELTEHMLLNDYAPACVLISEKGEGLYFYGDTSRYLKPPSGEASWNILGLAREGLRLDLSSALRKVVTHRKAIRYEKIKVQTNGDSQLINLTVKPLLKQSTTSTAMLVVFEDVEPSEAADAHALPSEPSVAGDSRMVDLERELRSNREYLQTTIEELETSNEELKSTNEELQSSNEELQSTNEELETSKEELQSVNEELVTVNAEHEVKLDELSKANNDMANLLASTDVGTIFLDNELHIQRFTPSATRLIKLIMTDIGRPLSDIANNIKDKILADEVSQVLGDLIPREQEVQTQDGRWFLMRMRPYRTTENVIDGAVITFIDITEQKQVQEQLLALSHAVQHSPISVFITDAGGNIEYVNPHFTNVTGYTAHEVLGKNISLLKSAETPVKVIETMWQEIKKGKPWSGHVTNQRKDGMLYRDQLAIYPVTDEQGRVTHHVGIQTESPK